MSYNVIDTTTGKVVGTLDPTTSKVSTGSTGTPGTAGTGSTGFNAPSLQLTQQQPVTFQAAGAGAQSGGGGYGYGAGAISSMGAANNSAGYSGYTGGGSSGGDGGGSWLSDIEGIVNTVMGIFGTVNATTAQQFNQKLANDQLKMSKNQQRFNQNLATQGLGLQRQSMALNQATTASGLQTAGTNRYQAQVAFQQSQQDRSRQQKLMNSLSAGIAQGLASRQVRQQAPNKPIGQQVPALTSPTV